MNRIFITIIISAFIASLVFAQEKDISTLQNERKNLMPLPADVQWQKGKLAVEVSEK
jgi:hypothetical protein